MIKTGTKQRVSFKSSLLTYILRRLIMKSDTASKIITAGQMKELTSAVVQAIPTDLSFDDAQYWIGRKRDLGDGIRAILWGKQVKGIAELIANWQRFYTKFFGTAFDFSDVKIPEKQPGFDWLVVVAKGLTPNQVFDVCQKHFSCWRYRDDLDKETEGRNDREPKEHYAIWVRNRQEADEELKNRSAENLKENKIKGITLLERFLLELWYWNETGEHLDIQSITLCAGSRDSGGRVPDADYWNNGEFGVSWCDPQDANSYLRARAAVSF